MEATNRKPIIFSVDDDAQVLQSLRRDLRGEYKSLYRIISTASAKEGLQALEQLKKKGETVALFISDQRMPEMNGVEFLEQAKKIFPDSKRVLLTAYSDTDAAIKAINEVHLDYYLLKPWDPPAEKLYPVLNDLLDEWQSTYEPEFRGTKIIGYQYAPKSHAIKDFLSGNLFPYQWLDINFEEKAKELIELHQADMKSLPLVIFEDGTSLANPDIKEIAQKLGLQPMAKEDLYDVTIIGAGPAGLAAAVYGGSEGLKTLLVERKAPGGQAGTSSRIENYLGFPSGLSGSDLARRAVTQASRFGVEILSPQEVKNIELEGAYKKITMRDESVIHSKSIIITTGVDYRKLPAEGVEDFTGAGIYYGAAMTEANACKDKEVFIVGGGNSAGQGAVYLSNFAKKVNILIRKPDLSSSMSSYLIDQINAIDNIEVKGGHQIKKAIGDDHLSGLEIENINDNTVSHFPADALFIFIGARPVTDWMPDNILKDEKGFITTGRDLKTINDYQKTWKYKRDPLYLETCQPGVFAAGDVRSGAMNRVAAAVGEGSMAIKFVHQYLAEI